MNRAVMAFTGALALASAALAWFVSPAWLLLTAFVGTNLLQASVTGYRPAATLFRRLGMGAAVRSAERSMHPPSRMWPQARDAQSSASSTRPGTRKNSQMHSLYSASVR